jgi:A/G-specific adenine glycosylase
VLVIRDGEKVAIHKRANSGLLAGLYELPNVSGFLDEDAVISYVKQLGYAPLRIQELSDAKHIFSHVEWLMKGYVVFVEALELKEEGKEKDLLFVEAEDAGRRYAIPTAFIQYARYMNIPIGAEAVRKQMN